MKITESKLREMVRGVLKEYVEPEGYEFNAETMKDLIFSLAWAGHSAYHSENVRTILASLFPEHDWSAVIEAFMEDRDSPPGPGSPK